MIDKLADDHDLFLVRLAAWYHDAVYAIPPGQVSNEEASARLALRELSRAGWSRRTESGRTAGTAYRDSLAGPRDPEGELICDADLAILARDPRGVRRLRRGRSRGVCPGARARLPRRTAEPCLPSLLTGELFRTAKGPPTDQCGPGQPRHGDQCVDRASR